MTRQDVTRQDTTDTSAKDMEYNAKVRSRKDIKNKNLDIEQAQVKVTEQNLASNRSLRSAKQTQPSSRPDFDSIYAA